MADSARSSRHVLVVNDTAEIIDLFRDILEGMGHRMTATSYAPEDLAEVTKINPDLAIIDLLIGGDRAGWQLVQKMRMSRETEKIPIIVCTAATEQVREQEGWLTTKGVRIVLKPFQVEDLEQAVEKALAMTEVRPD